MLMDLDWMVVVCGMIFILVMMIWVILMLRWWDQF